MEIETDKAMVEIEAPAAGVLANVTAQAGDVVAVGKTIAVILAPGEAPALTPPHPHTPTRSVPASPVAARMAAEHSIDLGQIKPSGGKIQKEDVLAYLAAQQTASAPSQPAQGAAVAGDWPRPRRAGWRRSVAGIFD